MELIKKNIKYMDQGAYKRATWMIEQFVITVFILVSVVETTGLMGGHYRF